MNPLEIVFQYSQSVWLTLFVVPLLFGAIQLHRYRKKVLEKTILQQALMLLLIKRSPLLSFTKIAGWIMIIFLAIIALMGPIGNLRYTTSPQSVEDALITIPHEVVFVVDTSASMDVNDGYDGKTRLREAQSIMTDIVSQLKGETISLYAFTSTLTPLVPPSVDYLFVRLMIQKLHIDEGDVGGTHFDKILKSLKEQAFSSTSSKLYSLIFLSDGGDNFIDQLQGNQRIQAIQQILNALTVSKTSNLHFYTIGIGSTEPKEIPHVTDNFGKPVQSALEPELLKQLADHHEGKFYQTDQWTSWTLSKDIVSQINQESFITKIENGQNHRLAKRPEEDLLFDLYYQVPLGIAILLFFLNLLLPDVKR